MNYGFWSNFDSNPFMGPWTVSIYAITAAYIKEKE
jgi:hypothetical protein